VIRHENWKEKLKSVLVLASSTGRIRIKVKLSLCLTKHHAMKTYWGVEV
jgi:hypothetical protein